MPERATIDDLLDIGIGDALSTMERADLAAIASVETVAAGELIFREGQSYSRIHWVASGRITLEMTARATMPKAILTVGSGDMLAWSSLVGNGRMTATATTIRATKLIGFAASELRSLCESNHQIGYRLMQLVARGLSCRLLATRLQLLDLFSAPSEPTL